MRSKRPKILVRICRNLFSRKKKASLSAKLISQMEKKTVSNLGRGGGDGLERRTAATPPGRARAKHCSPGQSAPGARNRSSARSRPRPAAEWHAPARNQRGLALKHAQAFLDPEVLGRDLDRALDRPEPGRVHALEPVTRELAETKGHSTLPHEADDHTRGTVEGGVAGGALPMSAGTSFQGRRKPKGSACLLRLLRCVRKQSIASSSLAYSRPRARGARSCYSNSFLRSARGLQAELGRTSLKPACLRYVPLDLDH